MADGKIEIDLSLGMSSYKRDLDKSAGIAKKSGEKAGAEYSGGFKSAVSTGLGFIGANLFLNALSGVKNAVGGVVREAAKLEVYETQFKVILKSTEAAQAQLESLRDFAASTPFELDGLALATRQLLSFGVAQENIIPTLRQIGDLAAGTGSAIEDLTIPYGRLISTQKLTLVELDKFADRGINLYGKLSEQTGISLKDIRNEISKGRIGFEQFTKALNDLTSEGGLFFQATKKQSETLTGLYSTLNDNMKNLAATIGKTLEPAIKSLVSSTIESVGALTRAFKNLNETGSFFGKGLKTQAKEAADEIERLENQAGILERKLKAQQEGQKTWFGRLIGNPQEVRDQIAANELALQEALQRSMTINAKIEANRRAQFGFIGPEQPKEQESTVQKADQERATLTNIFNDITTGQQQVVNGNEMMVNAFQRQAMAMTMTAKQMSDSIAKTMISGLGRGFATAFASMGAALANGENAMKAFAKSMFMMIGDIAIQLGTSFIMQGIAHSLNPLTPGLGGPLIAAGAALATVGGAIKALGGGGGGAVGATGGVGGGAGAEGFSPVNGFGADQIQQEGRQPDTNIAVNIQGDVLDSEETGLKIVNLINDSFDKTGAVIARGAVA